jgi:hypothetical protein
MRRNELAVHPEGPQQRLRGHVRGDRLARPVATQVQVQLRVRVAVRGLVRPVHRERRLAHPRRAIDRDDGRRAAGGGRLRVGQQRVERGQLVESPREPRDVVG